MHSEIYQKKNKTTTTKNELITKENENDHYAK